MGKKPLIILVVILITGVVSAYVFLRNSKKISFRHNQSQLSENGPNDQYLIDEDASSTSDDPDSTTQESVGDVKKQVDNDPKDNVDIKKDKLAESEDKNEENQAGKLEIMNKLVSWGYQKSSNRKIDTIVIHSSYNAVGSDPFDLGDIINKEYRPYGVSPHYIIDRDGKMYRLVEDKNIAYHAGDSKMSDGRTNVNSFSIGIEIVTSKTTKPTDAQYSALKYLISSLKARYPIKDVLGHKDIAPGRKDDPWNFDWSRVK